MAFPDDLIRHVGDLLREVAARSVLPRFRRLQDREIHEKQPGELVTIADQEAEAALTGGLRRLLPGSRVVGEEACAADPSLLLGIGTGLVWLVDPLDGTADFAAGDPRFSLMVALLRDGDIIAPWMLDPLAKGSPPHSAAPAPGSRARGSC